MRDRCSGERLLLVGWPGAEWRRAAALIEAGALPHLAQVAASGCVLPHLVTPPPSHHAALWTTLATGVLADRHGVLTDQECRPDGGGVQDAGQRSWQAPAFWEVMEQAGLRTMCVGWPATAPGARWPGCHVDERFGRATGSSFETWAMPPDVLAPAALRDTLRGLRIHPADGLRSQVLGLLPESATIDPRFDQRPLLLEAALAQIGTMHAAATYLAEGDWDVLCTCYDLLRLIGSGAATDSGELAESNARLRTRAYALQDMMLGRLVELAGPETTVMVVSAGTGTDMPQPGFLVASGAEIPAGVPLAAALTDVAPTILARFGLAAEMEGTAILALSSRRQTPAPQRAVPFGKTLPFTPVLADFSTDTLGQDQLAALRQQEVDALFALAEVQIARGDMRQAARTLERLRQLDPKHLAALQRLVECRGLLGDAAACLKLAHALLDLEPDRPWGHVAMAAWCVLMKEPAAAKPHLDRALLCDTADLQVLLRVGGLHLLRTSPHEAVSVFEAATKLNQDRPEAFYGLGVAWSAAGNLPAARQALLQAIALQPLQPLAHLQHAAVLAAQGQWRASVAAAETALQQRPGLPSAEDVLIKARTGLAQQIATAGRTGTVRKG